MGNMVCNVIYSLLCASILASYVLMETPPPILLILGVFCCWSAYIAFLALYSIALWSPTDLASIGPLYYAGSYLFIFGSAFFMMTTSGISWWGSTAFGIGSIFFVMDAHGVGSGYYNCTIGLATFLVGRFCFVLASRTERVGLCSIKFNHSKKSINIPSLSSLSSHGQNILNQITLIMDDMKGDHERVQDKVYVELSMLERLRLKDVNLLRSKPFSLGKVEEVYSLVKGSLVPRCCIDNAASKSKVADEEQEAVATKDL